METKALISKINTLAVSLPKDHSATRASLKTQSDLCRESLLEENILKEVSESMKVLQESVSKSTITFVETFLTKGVQSVYHDRNFKIRLVVGDRGQRKTLSVRVVETLEGGSVIESDITNGSGGGIRVVVSFLLQVMTILNRGLEPTVFLDENFSAVSSEYLDGLFEVIGELKSEFGFNFLMITQDPRFHKYADSTYKVKSGVYTKQ